MSESKIRTVSQLKELLQRENLSPERLASQINLSNMTIRRLLRKPDVEQIPAKYHAQFDRLFSTELVLHHDFSAVLDDIEKAGREVTNLISFKKDLKTKLKDIQIGKSIRAHVSTLLHALENAELGLKKKSICLGALLYLMNPADLIPDATPGVGYLDDFAVIELATAYVSRSHESEAAVDPSK